MLHSSLFFSQFSQYFLKPFGNRSSMTFPQSVQNFPFTDEVNVWNFWESQIQFCFYTFLHFVSVKYLRSKCFKRIVNILSLFCKRKTVTYHQAVPPPYRLVCKITSPSAATSFQMLSFVSLLSLCLLLQ